MSTGNSLRSAIRCTAAWRAGAHAFRGHPLAFHEQAFDGGGGLNRGVVVHVLLHTRNFPLRHPGPGVDFFGPGHSGEDR